MSGNSVKKQRKKQQTLLCKETQKTPAHNQRVCLSSCTFCTYFLYSRDNGSSLCGLIDKAT